MIGPRLVGLSLIPLLTAFLSSPVEAVVYNIPPDPVPGTVNSGDMINWGVGGVLPDGYSLPSGSILNVDGGSFGPMPADNPLQSSGEVNVFSTPPDGNGSVGMLSGGNLTLYDGHLAGFSIGAEINILGGNTGVFLPMFGSVMNIHDGDVGLIDGLSSSQLNIHGGVIAAIDAADGSEINIVNGTITRLNDLFFTTVNMSGGTIEEDWVLRETTLNIDGGNVLGALISRSGTEVNVTGTSFLLDGVPIPGLNVGVPFEVTDRDVVLTATLLDGSSLTINLSLDNHPDYEYPWFSEDAILRVTLIPEPTSIALLLIGGIFSLSRFRAASR